MLFISNQWVLVKDSKNSINNQQPNSYFGHRSLEAMPNWTRMFHSGLACEWENDTILGMIKQRIIIIMSFGISNIYNITYNIGPSIVLLFIHCNRRHPRQRLFENELAITLSNENLSAFIISRTAQLHPMEFQQLTREFLVALHLTRETACISIHCK